MVHDVPVGVIPQRNWDDYEEPAMPDFDVSGNNFLIWLPFFKVFLSLFFSLFSFLFKCICTNQTMPVMLRLTKALSQDFKTRYPKCAIVSAQINNQ